LIIYLCNSKRLIVKRFLRHVIEAEKAVGEKAGRLIYTSRMPLTLFYKLGNINFDHIMKFQRNFWAPDYIIKFPEFQAFGI
jgi:hypothetical protein